CEGLLGVGLRVPQAIGQGRQAVGGERVGGRGELAQRDRGRTEHEEGQDQGDRDGRRRADQVQVRLPGGVGGLDGGFFLGGVADLRLGPVEGVQRGDRRLHVVRLALEGVGYGARG